MRPIVPLVAALAAAVLALAAALPASAKDKAPEWAPGVPYTTDYEDAIKLARESGRMLLIYNGWEKPNI